MAAEGVSPKPMKSLAQHLLVLEAERQTGTGGSDDVAMRVFDKLRVALSRFAGSEGYSALLRRALVLARIDYSALQAVKVKSDGSLAGLEEAAMETGAAGTEAVIAIICHFLDLLAAFVGEPIAMRLVRDAWPDVPLSEFDRGGR